METFFDSTTNFQQELVSLQGERGGVALTELTETEHVQTD